MEASKILIFHYIYGVQISQVNTLCIYIPVQMILVLALLQQTCHQMYILCMGIGIHVVALSFCYTDFTYDFCDVSYKNKVWRAGLSWIFRARGLVESFASPKA